MRIAKIDVFKVMTSKEMEALTGVRHDNIKRTIDTLSKTTYNDDGSVKKQAVISHPQIEDGKKSANGVTEKVYLVNKRDSYVIVAQLSPEFTARLVDRWQELEAKEVKRQQEAITRSISRVEFKPMNSALEEARKEVGKDTLGHHYSNEADMINRIVLGKSSAQFKNFHGMEKDDSVRDHLNDAQIEAIIGLQRANMVYIQDGMLFDERKDRLKSLYIRKFDKAVVDKLYELEA